jgi:hypothetical protein
MPNMGKILIIDDDPELRGALTEQLSLYEEYEVAAENGNDRGATILGPRNAPLERENPDLLASPYTDSGTFNLGRLDSGAKFVVGLLSGYSGLAEAPKRAPPPE